MEYLFATEKGNYEDFSSGRVLYNAQGTTSFPVRLASEIIQRCFQLLRAKGHNGPYNVYDPCCGGAYLLTVVGLLHGRHIQQIMASDIDAEVLGIAERNISLLTPAGLEQRTNQLKQLYDLYKKPSHREALQSADRLVELVEKSSVARTTCFQADITAPGQKLGSWKAGANIIITDLPYGDIVSWESGSPDPVESFFDHIYETLDPANSVAAVVADKSQKLRHDKFRRVQYFKIGKRHAGLFEPLNN